MIRHIDELLSLAKKLPKQTIAVVVAEDEPVIKAVTDAIALGIVEAILIGNRIRIMEILIALNHDPSTFNIIDASSNEDAAFKALELIRTGKATILMKGLLDTKILLKAVLDKERGMRDKPMLSHVALIDVPTHDRLLLITDGGMNIAPTVEHKKLILENALMVTKKLGYACPYVGLVSAVEKVNEKMQSTVDAKQLVDWYNEGLIRDCVVGGPFAIDNLVSLEASKHKGIEDPVAGNADILLFPNIEAGNVFYKTTVFLANAKSAGMIVGAKRPIVLTSRADNAEAKLYAIALAAVCAV